MGVHSKQKRDFDIKISPFQQSLSAQINTLRDKGSQINLCLPKLLLTRNLLINS